MRGGVRNPVSAALINGGNALPARKIWRMQNGCDQAAGEPDAADMPFKRA